MGVAGIVVVLEADTDSVHVTDGVIMLHCRLRSDGTTHGSAHSSVALLS